MINIITVLAALTGSGLGEALGPLLYPDQPRTWLFIRAFCASALAWLTYAGIGYNNRQQAS